MYFVVGYAPTEEKQAREKGHFWNALNNVIIEVPVGITSLS